MEKTKYEIYRIVMNTLAQSTSWKEFVGHLKEEGVEMELVMRRKDSQDPIDIQGICFIKDDYTFKASQIRARDDLWQNGCSHQKECL